MFIPPPRCIVIPLRRRGCCNKNFNRTVIIVSVIPLRASFPSSVAGNCRGIPSLGRGNYSRNRIFSNRERLSASVPLWLARTALSRLILLRRDLSTLRRAWREAEDVARDGKTRGSGGNGNFQSESRWPAGGRGRCPFHAIGYSEAGWERGEKEKEKKGGKKKIVKPLVSVEFQPVNARWSVLQNRRRL